MRIRSAFIQVLVISSGACQGPLLDLQPLRPEESYTGNHTCYWLRPPNHEGPREQIFVVPDFHEGFIRVDGVHHTLKRIKTINHPSPRKGSEIGRRETQIWSDGQMQVEIKLKVIGYDESTHFKGTLSIQVGAKRRLYQIWGNSGTCA